ncbi:MAG: methionine--tRNA ligase [Proteobacteria bacterium]|nr:methionine--tRNA ligase [Pseudomonadota bacterium]
MPKFFYITTPIYYVNDKPHIGHAYTSIVCDIMARFMVLDGYQVKFLTGTDEHGQKVEKAACAKGLDPKEFTDQLTQTFQALTPLLGLTNNDFIRTTENRHIQAVQHLWNVIEEKGYIYLGKYSGWYAVREEAFYQEDELINGKAPTGADVEWVTEPSYFFKLSAFQEKLLDFYQKHPNFIAPETRRNEVVRFVERGLKDLSISRTSFKWGIPVPKDPKHVMYVWFDALTNYISALGYPKTDLSKGFWPEALHVVGKDILRFHAVYWPAFLMAANLPLPKRIFAHGWWTNEGEKISKSLNNTIDPLELIEKYGLDAVRYFLVREIPFGQDGDFSKTALVNRVNSDLSNAYGNLVQRVLSFVYKNCSGQIPKRNLLEEDDQKLLNLALNLVKEARIFIKQQALHKLCENIWNVIYAANRYVDVQKPWVLKNENPIRMETVLNVLCNVIRRLAIITQPILPCGSSKILDQLNVKDRSFNVFDQELVPGTVISEPQAIFPRWE